MATSSPPPPTLRPPGSPFPRKVALAALTATALLYAWHRLKDPTAGLAPGIFRQAAELRLPHVPTPVSPTEPLNGIQQPTASKTGSATKPGTPPPISPFLLDCGSRTSNHLLQLSELSLIFLQITSRISFIDKNKHLAI